MIVNCKARIYKTTCVGHILTYRVGTRTNAIKYKTSNENIRNEGTENDDLLNLSDSQVHKNKGLWHNKQLENL